MADQLPVCGARTKQCRKCGHAYSRDEYELWACPECGEKRGCTRRVRAAGERCRNHGGASLRGAAHPMFRTGRYSKFLPDKLAARYAEAVSDAELLDLRHEIALIDLRISALVERLGTGESAENWGRLIEAYDQLKSSQAVRDVAGLADALSALGAVIEGGKQNESGWKEVIELLERRRRLVDSETKRLALMQQFVTSQQLVSLAAAVLEVIRENVSESATRARIADGIRNLISGNGDRRS